MMLMLGVIGTAAIVGLGLGAIVLIWLVSTYNGLVSRRMACTGGWAQIDVQLKRRYDLIPNLVETVKGYAAHEKETLAQVIAARNQGMAATTPQAAAAAESALAGPLGRLMAISEAYPDLKANAGFVQLQGELASTESQISAARQGYNRAVQAYNASIAMFPTAIVAGMMAFREEPFFEIQSFEEREAPKVKF